MVLHVYKNKEIKYQTVQRLVMCIKILKIYVYKGFYLFNLMVYAFGISNFDFLDDFIVCNILKVDNIMLQRHRNYRIRA